MLLGTSQTHWWSNRRCVLLERIGDSVSVHDLGLGLGPSNWVRYPILPTDSFRVDKPVSAHDVFGNEIAAHGVVGDSAMGNLASTVSDLVSDVLVDKMMSQRVCKFAEHITHLAEMSPEQRQSSAALRFRTLNVEKVVAKDTTDGRWLLTSTSPRGRFYVTAARADIAEVEARLAALLGN